MENSIISISLAFEAAATGQLLCIMEITIMPDMLSSCRSRYLRSEKLFFLPVWSNCDRQSLSAQTMLGVSRLLNCNLFLAIFFHFHQTISCHISTARSFFAAVMSGFALGASWNSLHLLFLSRVSTGKTELKQKC